MLQRIVMVVLSLPFVIIVSAYLLPTSTEVSRSIVIERSASEIFPYINNLENMQLWSPWAKKDPNMQVTYSGSQAGVRAVMQWKSNKPDVGAGRQEIIESELDKHVALSFAFEKQPAAEVHFYLEPLDNNSKLSWKFIADHGTNPINRYMGLLFDGMLGPDFESGLKDLKTLLENQAVQEEEQQQTNVVQENLSEEIHADEKSEMEELEELKEIKTE